MKKTTGIFLLSLLVVILSASFVVAGNMYGPQIKHRRIAQQKWVDKGFAPESLTRTEARKLRKLRYHLNCIRAEGSRLNADCHLTTRERARLHRMLDKNRKNFYCKRYNNICRLY